MDRSLNPRWEPGTWLGRCWGSASHIVAVSAAEVRGVRAVARRPLGKRWSREVLQGLVSVPWVSADPAVYVRRCVHARPARH
eukprot:3423121-Alexandrium_andersonii.AAC.1